MDLNKTLAISASGLGAEANRLKTIAENLANADSTGLTPGSDPYRRKVATFRNVLDRETGVQLVKAQTPRPDASEFERRYNPSSPAADATGYVRMPNVNPMIELSDMREAQRSYQANLSVIDAAKGMLSRTIDVIRG
jgi:flagellar basal-body rod protein FlgC